MLLGEVAVSTATLVVDMVLPGDKKRPMEATTTALASVVFTQCTGKCNIMDATLRRLILLSFDEEGEEWQDVWDDILQARSLFGSPIPNIIRGGCGQMEDLEYVSCRSHTVIDRIPMLYSN
jgi:hypothetical protein